MDQRLQIKTVLVPLDFSRASMQALLWQRRRARCALCRVSRAGGSSRQTQEGRSPVRAKKRLVFSEVR
jgi:hypothetical protein